MFKEQFYNERVEFDDGSTVWSLWVDDMQIVVRPVEKRSNLADDSVFRALRGVHLDITLSWNWFETYKDDTPKTSDILSLYKVLLENTVTFRPNPDDGSPSDITVILSQNNFTLVSLEDKVRQGDFELQLETQSKIENLDLLDPLGFQII